MLLFSCGASLCSLVAFCVLSTVVVGGSWSKNDARGLDFFGAVRDCCEFSLFRGFYVTGLEGGLLLLFYVGLSNILRVSVSCIDLLAASIYLAYSRMMSCQKHSLVSYFTELGPEN